MKNMSKKKKKYNDGVERDEKGLTASDRAIIDSIDFEKIGADAAAHMEARLPEIMAEAKASAMAKTKASVGKTRRTGVLSLLIGIFIIIGGVLSLDAGIGIYLLISGALILIFGICMFSIASSNKKLVADYESGKVIDPDVASQQDAKAEEMLARFKETGFYGGNLDKSGKDVTVKKTDAGYIKKIVGVLLSIMGAVLIIAALTVFYYGGSGPYVLGAGLLLLIIAIIMFCTSRSKKKNS